MKLATQRDIRSLRQQLDETINDEDMSSDAKIFSLVNIFSQEYSKIISSRGGSNSRLGKQIKNICEQQFGVTLTKKGIYFKEDGLLLAMLRRDSNNKGHSSLLPQKPQITTHKPQQVSKSAPLDTSIELTTFTTSKNFISEPIFTEKSTKNNSETKLRKSKELSRMGTLFGNQFCYAEKPGGVEPGFRAIDCNEAFFEFLESHLRKSNNKALANLAGNLSLLYTLKAKQKHFSEFINTRMDSPHAPELIDKTVEAFCNMTKEAVKQDQKESLSAWMYKLDYAENDTNRVKTNKEALREFVGTRLAGIFSVHNQKQKIVWVQGQKGAHAILACGWKNGLQELKTFLHGGEEPDWNGILVEDKEALVKKSKYIPGLGKNLILGIALGDRDGVGKEAQNKGYANGAFYGFDYGKPYEGEGVTTSLQEDFSFEDKWAKKPAFLRSSSVIGFARHFMYRNYNVFYDTALSERMEGVHLLNKMITGQDPSPEVLQSYPSLTKQLIHIKQATPTNQELFKKLKQLSLNYSEPTVLSTINKLLLQTTDNMSPFERYFLAIKIELLEQTHMHGIDATEQLDYLQFIDEMADVARVNNANILQVFEPRLKLSKEEVNFLDNLEKLFSPASVMSHDGEVFLNHLRVSSPEKRIAFHLTKNKEGNYILKSESKTAIADLKSVLEIEPLDEHAIELTSKQLMSFMKKTQIAYQNKKEQLLIKPRFEKETIPLLKELLDYLKISIHWIDKGAARIEIDRVTEEQIDMLSKIFHFKNRPQQGCSLSLRVDSQKLTSISEQVRTLHEEEFKVKEPLVLLTEGSGSMKSMVPLLDKSLNKSPTTVSEETINARLAAKMDEVLQGTSLFSTALQDAIHELSTSNAEKIMLLNDETLKDPLNIQHIISDNLHLITIHIPQQSSLLTNDSSQLKTSFL